MQIVIMDDWDRAFIDSPLLSRLEELGDVTVYTDRSSGREETIRRLEPADVTILIRERTAIDASMFDDLPRLKFIAQTGGGASHIDHVAREAHGVEIAYTPGSRRSVVELIFGLAIASLREIPRNDRLMHQGEWPQRTGRILSGKRLSVIGFGKIGSDLVPAARIFGMDVLAWGREGSRQRAAERDVPFTPDLTDAFRQGDIVSVGMRLDDSTRGLVKAEHLEALRPGSLLINTSRGAIIEEKALIDRLSRGDISAAIDVFHEEPLPPGHPLRKMDNVILSPHIGWITDDNYATVVPGCIENVREFVASCS